MKGGRWCTGRALLLVLLLTAGLFTMHTIGHLGTHATPMAGVPVHAHEAAPATEAALASHDQGFPLGPLMVCVAILLALVTLASGLALLARLDLRALLRNPAALCIAASGRAPPVPRIGLLIADLSILRT